MQFQEDRRFYDRTIPEIMLYLAQNERVTNWHFVIWVAREHQLPPLSQKYQLLSGNITIFYLNRLPDGANPSLGVSMIALIVCPAKQALVKVSELRQRLQSITEPSRQRLMVDLMETVLVYKFDTLSWQEIEAMFGLNELKQTRVYQEARFEGVQLGEVKLLIRQLSRRFGKLSLSQQEQIAALPQEELEQLGEALLDWQSPADLPDWLRPA